MHGRRVAGLQCTVRAASGWASIPQLSKLGISVNLCGVKESRRDSRTSSGFTVQVSSRNPVSQPSHRVPIYIVAQIVDLIPHCYLGPGTVFG